MYVWQFTGWKYQIVNVRGESWYQSMLNTQHIDPWRRWATAEDHTRRHTCHLRTGNGGFYEHRLTNVATSIESRFLMENLDGSNRIWGNRQESFYHTHSNLFYVSLAVFFSSYWLQRGNEGSRPFTVHSNAFKAQQR